jgi:two-component system, LuxR family, response regulator FixJ
MTTSATMRVHPNNDVNKGRIINENAEIDSLFDMRRSRVVRLNSARRDYASALAGKTMAHRAAEEAAGPLVDGRAIEAPPSPGLMHSYLIDPDDERRLAIHKMLSGRSNMIVRTYRSREHFLAVADTLDEGCVILADHSDGDALVGFIRRLRQEQRFACVLLAREQDIRTAIEAMKAGAVDCLLYPGEVAGLLSSVDDALMQIQQLVDDNAALVEARRQIERLTARELDVLQGLLHGKSNKMIALDLAISPRTVEIYRAHLMEKLGTHSLSETLKIAFAAGMG